MLKGFFMLLGTQEGPEEAKTWGAAAQGHSAGVEEKNARNPTRVTTAVLLVEGLCG